MKYTAHTPRGTIQPRNPSTRAIALSMQQIEQTQRAQQRKRHQQRLIAWAAFLVLVALFTVLGATNAHAQKMTFGVASNLGSAGLLDARETFVPLATHLGRDVKQSIETVPVSASLIKTAITSGRYDLMLVRTSDAAYAQVEHGWRILALSQDNEPNVVALLAAKGNKITKLQDAKGARMAAQQGIVVETLRAVVRQAGMTTSIGEVKEPRDPDTPVWMLQNNFADVIAVKGDANIKKVEAVGGRVIHKTEPIPNYVLIANPKMDLALLKRVGDSAQAFAPSGDLAKRAQFKSLVALNADHSTMLSLFEN